MKLYEISNSSSKQWRIHNASTHPRWHSKGSFTSETLRCVFAAACRSIPQCIPSYRTHQHVYKTQDNARRRTAPQRDATQRNAPHLVRTNRNTPFTRYITTGLTIGLTTVSNEQTVRSTGCQTGLYNRFDNPLNVRIPDTAGCHTGCQTGLTTVDNRVERTDCSFNTVVKPVVQPGLTTGLTTVLNEQPLATVRSFNRLSNRVVQLV